MDWLNWLGMSPADDPQTGKAVVAGNTPTVSTAGADDGNSSWLGTLGATVGSIADAYAKIEVSKATKKETPVVGKDAIALPGWVYIAGIVLILAIIGVFVWRKG